MTQFHWKLGNSNYAYDGSAFSATLRSHLYTRGNIVARAVFEFNFNNGARSSLYYSVSLSVSDKGKSCDWLTSWFKVCTNHKSSPYPKQIVQPNKKIDRCVQSREDINRRTNSYITIKMLQCEVATLLYEDYGPDLVTVNTFPSPSHHMTPGLAWHKHNPITRLKSCSELGAGRFIVYGDCSTFVECAYTNGTYSRRLMQCPSGLWFSATERTCALPASLTCPHGRLVRNPHNLRASIESCEGATSSLEVRTLPGCTGYYTCRTNDLGVERYTYECGTDHLWNGTVCVPASQVNCNSRVAGALCVRDCVSGDARTCTFNFIIEEYASMSVYCKNCPFIQSDCELNGCVPAGGIRKFLFTVNRQIPGTAIQVCKGDTIEVLVENKLPADGISIHWHGLHQTATPFMDGVAQITQCPINPGNSFKYSFLADVSGTHLYHSHVGHQETDGFHGPMIVREPRASDPTSSRYDQDLPEHHMIIWHWFDVPAESQSIDQRIVSLIRDGYGLLINGKAGIQKYRDQYGLAVFTPAQIFYVTTGVRFRFRIIFNSAINCPIQLSVDDHVMDVLALDGRPIQTMDFVDALLLSAGERIDIVLHPQAGVDTANKSYYIRARGLNDCDDTNKEGVHEVALLNYDGTLEDPDSWDSYGYANRPGLTFNSASDLPRAPDATPMIGVPLTAATDALPADPAYAGTPDKIFYMDVRFQMFIEEETLVFVYPQLNNISYVNPPIPPLTQSNEVTPDMFCSPGNTFNCVNGQCMCPNTIEVATGDLVEFVLYDPNGIDIGHPFHLHGYVFRVVSLGQLNGTIYYERIRDMNEAGQFNKRYDTPLKDTLVVPGHGYAVLRFIATNPGYWLFHCHVTEHMLQGMALLVKVGNHSEMVAPPSNFRKCGNFA